MKIVYPITLIFLSAASGFAADELEKVYILEEYTVSAGPEAKPLSDFVSPLTTVDEDDIRKSGSSTLGDLLDGQAGIAATSFGGGASRPIIRGFDGSRVSIVESGLGSLDVSDTSPDHAITIEPLLTERVEVLRGPATLLYGSSAIGGVVNTIGREISRKQSDKLLTGAAEARFDTVSQAETFLGYASVSEGPFAFNIQALRREAQDYDIPGAAELHGEDEHEDGDHDEEEEHGSDRLESSLAENDFYSLGTTWFLSDRNYLGLSVSQYNSEYGVPGHEHGHHDEEEDDRDHDEEEEGSVVIDLERTRLDTELAIFEPIDWISAARFRFGYTDYEHREFEGDEAGTLFLREGWELRAEATHGDTLIFDEGIFGVQISDSDFEARGEEGAAFGPPAETLSQAFFISEHIHMGAHHYDFGLRVERQTIDSTGNDYSDTAFSISLAKIWNIDEQQSIAISLQRTQRHPTSTELFANGAHLATSQFEIGDDSLDLETAYGLDLGYRLRTRDWKVTASLFYAKFDDYIYAQATGAEKGKLDVYAYTAVDATFYGYELEAERILYAGSDALLTAGLISDYVLAENDTANTDLPRIPPFRIGGEIAIDYKEWNAALRVRQSFDQQKHGPNETETDGFTELEVNLSYAFELSDKAIATVFFKGENLLDEEIRHHTSFIKDQAPLPGKNFTIGARLDF